VRPVLVETTTHGRILIGDPAVSFSGRVLIGCHGYAQNAAILLDEMRRIPGADAWRLISVQALHRFYTRGDQAVVASWMTREDRDAAIADNTAYLARVVREHAADATTIDYLGFSQGASMAARAAARVEPPARGLILLGGDIPPDVRDDPAVSLPPVLIGCGDGDSWYAPRLEGDVAFLRDRGISHTVVRFEGGHEFTDAFREAAGRFLR
jgi:predicted esterase